MRWGCSLTRSFLLSFVWLALILWGAEVGAGELGPFQLASYEEVSNVLDLALIERDGRTYALVAGHDGGENLVAIVDVTEAARPAEVKRIDLPEVAYQVEVRGDYAYVLTRDNRLHVIQLRTPVEETQLLESSVSLGVGTPKAMVFAGDYAFVADGGGGLKVLEVSDPVHPRLVGNLSSLYYAEGVWVAGDYAFVANGWSGLAVIDVSNPASPRDTGVRLSPEDYDYARGIQVVGGLAYLADGGQLLILDVSNPLHPVIKGSVELRGASRVLVSGGLAYVAARDYGLWIVDVAQPESPQALGHVDTNGIALSVYLKGDYAFVADDCCGLDVIDVSDPESPPILGSIETGEARGVFVQGDLAYVADGHLGGLKVLDVSRPEAPVLVGSVVFPGLARRVVVAGHYAFVAAGTDGLRVIDVSRPEAPQEKAQLDTANAQDVFVSGEYVFLADGPEGLRIVDVSQPEAPRLLATVNTGGFAQSVFVAGDYAYVGNQYQGLVVVDVAEPTDASLRGSVRTFNPLSVVVAGRYAYVADETNGLRVVDVSDPDAPEIVATVDTDLAVSVSLYGPYACVADREQGLKIVDLSRPEAPRLVGSVDTSYALDVQMVGPLAFVADYIEGLKIADLTPKGGLGETCGPGSLALCATEADCEAAGGYWCLDQCRALPCAPSPMRVEVKVNGSHDPGELLPQSPLVVTVSVDTAGITGSGDYFLRATLPGGETYWFVYPGGWVPSTEPVPAYSGPLASFEDLRVFGTTCQGLPGGNYELFFAVDDEANGKLDDHAAQDSVRFSVIR